MTTFTKLLTVAVAGAMSAPLAAQYYPQPGYPGYQGYPGYPGYQYPNQQYGYGQNAIGQIVDQLLGNRYNVSDRQAVRQCARAAMAQANAQYGSYGGYNGYNQYGYNQQQYGNERYRVTAITNVDRRSYGLRVAGLLSARGGYGGYGYGNQGYNGYAAGALSFRCNVAYRGAVTNVRVRPSEGYRRY